MTQLDPVAEIAFRQMVGRVLAVDRLLSDDVFSTRIEVYGQSWLARPWRTARRRYDDALRALRAGTYEGEAHLDVSNHYGTVTTELLRTVLNSGMAPAGAVADLTDALEMWQGRPGSPPGLPVGPEGSSLLGTIALIPTDRALLRHGYAFARWTDDYVVLLPSGEDFDALVEVAEEQLGRNGQQLNRNKVRWIERNEGGAVPASASEDNRMLAPDPVQALMLSAELRDPRGLTKALGLLRFSSDPSAIAVLEANPWVHETFPKQSAHYLRVVSPYVIDWDWVLDVVVADTDTNNAAAQLHLASVLPKDAVPRDTGADLFDKACRLRQSEFASLAYELFAVAGRSRERSRKRRGRALEMAQELAELNAKRALLAAFEDGSVDRHSQSGLRQLARNDPEIEMTADLVLAS